MSVRLEPRRLAVLVVLAAAALAAALLAVPPAGAAASPVASAAAKKCGAGKVLVKRPGRSSVCARRCPSGTKRKVSAKGRVSCAKRKSSVGSGPAPAPPAGSPAPPPAGEPAPPAPGTTGGPAAGKYSGETEQSRPVQFTVADGQVTGFEAGVNTWCSTQGNQRIVFDAIANVPPMAIGPDGTFSYTGDENNGNMKINGTVTGNTATGTVGMMRGDTNYSDGRMWFGTCSASDIKWSATAG